ncbi:MAG TPA: hypothetical protein VGQ86_09565 [Candidatus Limnocylindria bacterium]|jgi:hypothetical protein|nr:hypothetical protein [Candidatus Limnocylindria bacterium]
MFDRIALYCRCGSSFVIRFERDQEFEMARSLEGIWLAVHQGGRCGPTHAQGAAIGRILARRREATRLRMAG